MINTPPYACVCGLRIHTIFSSLYQQFRRVENSNKKITKFINAYTNILSFKSQVRL